MILALLTALAWAGEYEVHKSQAEVYVKRGYWSDALDELAAAMATAEGRKDPGLTWAAAQVCWELQDVGTALEMARRTVALASSDAERDRALAWAQSLEETFGFLTIEGPRAGMSSRLQLEVTSTLFDPELKQYVTKVAARLHGSTEFPVRVGLPVGEYLVNGEAAAVTAAGETRLVLPLAAVGQRGLAALQVARLEIALGVSAPLGERASVALPSPTVEMGISEPIGRFALGAYVGMAAEAYQADGVVVRTLAGGSVAARLAREIVLGGPLSLRPGIVARAGWVPGVPYRCDGADSWTCAPAEEAPDADHALYATARGIGVGGELLVEAREAGRTTSLGTGVRVGVEQLFGTVPSEAEVEVSGAAVPWTATDRTMEVTSFRMLAHVAMAF